MLSIDIPGKIDLNSKKSSLPFGPIKSDFSSLLESRLTESLVTDLQKYQPINRNRLIIAVFDNEQFWLDFTFLCGAAAVRHIATVFGAVLRATTMCGRTRMFGAAFGAAVFCSGC